MNATSHNGDCNAEYTPDYRGQADLMEHDCIMLISLSLVKLLKLEGAVNMPNTHNNNA
jgi:hypothetical protein